MRKKHLLHISLFIFLLAAISVSFSAKNRPSDKVGEQYKHDLLQFQTSLTDLSTKAAQLTASKKSIQELRNAFLKSRLAFKRIEFLLEHRDDEMVKEHLNGPPLPRLLKNAPQPIILEPEGFQMIEEHLFGEAPYDNKDEIIALIKEMTQILKPVLVTKNVYFSERVILEAAREELFRVFALGLTGFDSPVAEQGIPEAKAALSAVSEAVATFYPFVDKNEQHLVDKLQKGFDGALKYLSKQKSFDDLDRLHLLKEYIDPLYGTILDLHMYLQIETYYEVNSFKGPINYFAKSIFANDLLDPIYFTKQGDLSDPKLVELGRLLFFDPVLSSNDQRSCASCHNPDKAFTDGQAKSIGFNFEGTVDRNAPTLLNAVYATRYFYDVRVDVLERQVEHVVKSHKEFNTSYLEIFRKLKLSDEYVDLFEQSFPHYGKNAVSKNTVAMALAAYVASLRGFNSDFDKYVRGEIPELDASVKRGFNLFMGKAGCGSCHFAPVFNGTVPPIFKDTETEVLGVPSIADLKNPVLDADMGRADGLFMEQSKIYHRSFKTPTVRNIALTAPYMHNGVFKTLEEVLEFYDEGGGQGLGLDVPNQTLPPDKLGLSKSEKKDIIAFMKALNDTTGHTARPTRLPAFAGDDVIINNRVIGGLY